MPDAADVPGGFDDVETIEDLLAALSRGGAPASGTPGAPAPGTSAPDSTPSGGPDPHDPSHPDTQGR